MPLRRVDRGAVVLVDHTADEALAEHLERYGGELARLVPGLARRMPTTPAPARSDPQTERYLLFGAVVGFFQQVTGRRRSC